MNSEFVLGQGPGHKLEIAIRRNGGTAEDIEWLSTGENFAAVELLRTGKATLFLLPPRKQVVIPMSQISVVLAEQSNPDTFFQTREGLWVDPNFRRVVVANAKPVKVGTLFNLDHGLLTENMSDAKIETALPKEHLFDESSACAAITAMIKEQPDGKEGRLLNSGYANLFYLSSCVVRVSWPAGGRGWFVSAWKRGGREWFAGGQVFSPASA